MELVLTDPGSAPLSCPQLQPRVSSMLLGAWPSPPGRLWRRRPLCSDRVGGTTAEAALPCPVLACLATAVTLAPLDPLGSRQEQ